MFSIGSHQRCLRSLFRNYYSRPSAIIPARMEHPEPRQNKRSGKLRGNSGRDDAKTRMSKTLSYVLRHGAKDEGLPIRDDGYVRVKDLVSHQYFHPITILNSPVSLRLLNLARWISRRWKRSYKRIGSSDIISTLRLLMARRWIQSPGGSARIRDIP